MKKSVKQKQKTDRLLPDRNGRFLKSCDTMETALTIHGAEIGVKQNTAEVLAVDVKTFRGLDAQFVASRSRGKDELTPALRKADGDARKYINDARHVLKGALGSHSNQDWIDAGFLNSSFAVPRKMGDRDILVSALATYFNTHPHLENASLKVTAVAGTEIHKRLSGLQKTILNHNSKEKELSGKRTTALKALRKRVKGLISELKQLLAADDVRWMPFGVDSPAERKRKNAEARAQAEVELAAKVTQLPDQGAGGAKAA